MPKVRPFRALRYAADGAELAAVTSPPHDCISPDERQRLLRVPHSIVHVVLGDESPGDGDGPQPPSKAARAAGLLKEWQREGRLQRDARPAFYLYEASWGPPEQRRRMRGMMARVALDPTYTSVRRHEKTLGRKKQERLRLREATQCDTEPIWLLYKDPRGWVEEVLWSNSFDQLARFTDEDGTEHTLWRVERPEAVGEVEAQFEDRTLVIADGHHRYQTALEHYASTRDPRHGTILACLVRDNDPGMAVLPTHRIVHGMGFTVELAAERARRNWDVEPLAMPQPPELLADVPHPDGDDLVILGLDRERRLQAFRLRLRPLAVEPTARGRLERLAVVKCHERLLRDCWGLDPERPEDHLHFTRRADEAVAAAAAGDLAVFLPPELPEAVLEVAMADQVMPQKATYFVPKIRSGLVLSPLDEL